MLIGTSAKNDLIALLPGPPRQDIGIQQLHGETDVRIGINIGNRSRNVIFTHHL